MSTKRVLLFVSILLVLAAAGGQVANDGGPKKTADGGYEGIETKPFDQLKNDKRMKMTLFHWAGEKGGDDHITAMQTLRADSAHSEYLWFHVDVSTDEGAKAFKREDLPFVFAQTPLDGISHFISIAGMEFTESNFREWHAFRKGKGWKDGDKVVQLTKDDLPHKLEELSKKTPVFVKMYEAWCSHCAALKPHFKRSSNEVADVVFVEIECAKAGGFCDRFFPASGFPRVKFLNKGATKFHDYKGLSYKMMTEFGNDPSKWKFDADTGFGAKTEL
jgi:thiol-disulfide isomerase/thioredoxin